MDNFPSNYGRYPANWHAENRRHYSPAEQAEVLAEARRRANYNLMQNRAKRENIITHRAQR